MGVVASVLELRSLTSLFSFSRSPASEKCVLTLVLFLWITATAAVLSSLAVETVCYDRPT